MFDGLFLGFLGWIATFMMWQHLPKTIQRWSVRHFLITDMVVGFVTVYTMTSFSQSIVSMTAGVVTGLAMNFTMMAIGSSWGMKYFELEEPVTVEEPRRTNSSGWFHKPS